HLYVRARAIQVCFELSQSTKQKVDAINFAFDSGHHYLQALGLFLWRRQVDIPLQALKLSLLPVEYGTLFLAQDEVNAAANFRAKLADVLKINISPAFRLHDVFEDVKLAYQQI